MPVTRTVTVTRAVAVAALTARALFPSFWSVSAHLVTVGTFVAKATVAPVMPVAMTTMSFAMPARAFPVDMAHDHPGTYELLHQFLVFDNHLRSFP